MSTIILIIKITLVITAVIGSIMLGPLASFITFIILLILIWMGYKSSTKPVPQLRSAPKLLANPSRK